MADYGLNEYGAEAEDIARRRRYAEMLQQQSMSPLESQTAGGWVIPVSPLQGLAKMVQAYQGRKGIEDASERSKALAERLRGDAANWTAAMPQPTTQNLNLVPNDDEGNAMPAANVTKQPSQNEMMAWMLRGAQNPMTAPMVGSMMQLAQARETREDNQAFRTSEANANREFQAQQAQAQREARAQDIRMRLESERITAQERAALMRELKQMGIDASKAAQQAAMANRQPQIIQGENGPMILGPNNTATPVLGPDGQPLKGKGTEKALPTSAAQKLMENQANLRKAQTALNLISGQDTGGAKGSADATGWRGYVPEAILQRVDPEGIETRAAIGDLGSMVIHDRSGAAVTASEYPRLRPFIPLVTDDPATVKKKLSRFVTEYGNIVGEASDFYRESGYKVPQNVLRGGGAVPDEPPPGAVRPKGVK